MRHFLTQVTLLCGLAACLSTSCLVSEAPPLEGEEQVSPRIVLDNVYPSPFSIVQTFSDDALVSRFSVDFWSEDLGEHVLGFLYLNYPTPGTNLGGLDLAGGSLSDSEPRTMEILWKKNRDRPPGCYTVTMIIGHDSNFDTVDQVPLPDALDRVTFVTWTVAHDLPAHEISLDDCPQLGVEQGLN